MFASKITFPNYKWSVDMEALVKAIRKKDEYVIDNMNAEKFHNFLSKLYFETRKATELWSKGNTLKTRKSKTKE